MKLRIPQISFLKRIPKEERPGLYLTVITHLVVVIILLVTQISSTVRAEFSYLLDFSDIEERERAEQEAEFRESISDRIDELLAAAPYMHEAEVQQIRNIAVDAGSSALKDDRGTDADQLYRDAERLAQDLRSGAFAEDPKDAENYAAEYRRPETVEKQAEVYSGPSVVSYSLDGRKAVNLSIPAYRCLGGGDVTVRIEVNQSGAVVDVTVVQELSSQDNCLQTYARRAARLSRFSASYSAPKKQFGEIVYRFVAQ